MNESILQKNKLKCKELIKGMSKKKNYEKCQKRKTEKEWDKKQESNFPIADKYAKRKKKIGAHRKKREILWRLLVIKLEKFSPFHKVFASLLTKLVLYLILF